MELYDGNFSVLNLDENLKASFVDRGIENEDALAEFAQEYFNMLIFYSPLEQQISKNINRFVCSVFPEPNLESARSRFWKRY